MSFSIFIIHSNFLEDVLGVKYSAVYYAGVVCPDFSLPSCSTEMRAVPKMVKIILKNDMEGLALLNVMTFKNFSN